MNNLVQLAREMEMARRKLDDLPLDRQWTEEELAVLEDVRHAALRLASAAEATIETFQERT